MNEKTLCSKQPSISTPELVKEIKHCTVSKNLQRGKLLHLKAIESGVHNNIYVANTLVSMYSKCGDILQACSVFAKLKHPTVVSWTALILGYVENGEASMALDLFNSMDCAPNHVTFVAALKACISLATRKNLDKRVSLENGLAVHRKARALGLDKDMIVESTLLDMYSKSGDMSRARDVFNKMSNRDVVAWTALIDGYVENSQCEAALDMFFRMDCRPDPFVYAAALKACAGLAAKDVWNKKTCLRKGVIAHGYARELSFDKHLVVANALLTMYGKCGEMSQAQDVFNGISKRNVVSWTALIAAYVENGESLKALAVFNCMDCAPNTVTFVAALKACGTVGAFHAGRRIHDRVRELGWELEPMVATSLVDFYGKCGDMDTAVSVFNRLPSKDTVSWTALMGGYSLVGNVREVFALVKKMEDAAVSLNSVTMLMILTSCSHAGMVEECQNYFYSMLKKYRIKPTVEHYGCMVDMLGRANRLEEALSLIGGMPFAANSVIWTALLGACRKWTNKEIGEVAFNALLTLNEDKGSVAAAHVLMKDIYERLGMERDGEDIQAQQRTLKTWKRPGQSYWFDAWERVHSSGDGGKTDQHVQDKLKALLDG